MYSDSDSDSIDVHVHISAETAAWSEQLCDTKLSSLSAMRPVCLCCYQGGKDVMNGAIFAY